jgi:hypothetical protein
MQYASSCCNTRLEQQHAHVDGLDVFTIELHETSSLDPICTAHNHFTLPHSLICIAQPCNRIQCANDLLLGSAMLVNCWMMRMEGAVFMQRDCTNMGSSRALKVSKQVTFAHCTVVQN